MKSSAERATKVVICWKCQSALLNLGVVRQYDGCIVRSWKTPLLRGGGVVVVLVPVSSLGAVLWLGLAL